MIKHNIIGNAMQMLVTELSPGDEIYGEAGKFLWKTANVDMDTVSVARNTRVKVSWIKPLEPP